MNRFSHHVGVERTTNRKSFVLDVVADGRLRADREAERRLGSVRMPHEISKLFVTQRATYPTRAVLFVLIIRQ